ncbi:hypothetical protein ACFQMM_14735 [Saliphagus sp. GCM10025308]
MTDIELNYSRLDAIELVVTAFEHVRELSEYEVDAENGVVTGHFNGGVTASERRSLYPFSKRRTSSERPLL